MDLKVRANTAAFPRTDDTFSKSLIEQSQQSLVSLPIHNAEGTGIGPIGPAQLKSMGRAALDHLRTVGPVVGTSNTVGSHHISPGLLAEANEQPKLNFWQRAIRAVANYYSENHTWINPMIHGAMVAAGLLGPEEPVHMVNVLQVRQACREFLRVLHKQDAPQAVSLIGTIT